MSTDRLAFRAGERTVETELSAPDAVSFARVLFPAYQVPSMGARPVLRLLEHATGWRLHGPSDVRETEGLGDALVHFEMALAEALLHSLAGRHVLHAGGVETDGGAILFSGRGGVGKSTLTAAMAADGYPVYGDDVVLVSRGGTVEPFRRLLKLPERSRKLLGLPRPGTSLDELWPASNLYRPEQLGSRWADPARLGAVFFPERRSAEDDVDAELPELAPLSGGETVRRLFDQLLLEEPGASAFEALVDAVEEAAAFELRYADAHRVGDAVLTSLRTSRGFRNTG